MQSLANPPPPGQLAELTAWLDMVARAGEFANTFAQRGYMTPQAVARSGLTEENLRAMGMSKMKTRKAVLHALKGVASSPMMPPQPAVQLPLPEPPPMMADLEPEMPVDAFFAAPAGGGADAMGLAASPWGPGWAPTQPSVHAAAGSSESWNVRQRPPSSLLLGRAELRRTDILLRTGSPARARRRRQRSTGAGLGRRSGVVRSFPRCRSSVRWILRGERRSSDGLVDAAVGNEQLRP